jgi:hypothetical protein
MPSKYNNGVASGYAGTVKESSNGFIQLTKIVITISVLLAILMLTIK